MPITCIRNRSVFHFNAEDVKNCILNVNIALAGHIFFSVSHQNTTEDTN